ncbi:MAG TPA: response regulator transcription factor [Aromatoleum sp.]|uniref:response regulator transcription factor n=1 Tax=Aromatoleum sp. TaxID=2307007 RepID=UPI002B481A4F|nr:response regulator transcription factor [Aromatoleum sp.]HJV24354.1 response regulator transcription factor [Aromatoleum sp.]
MIRLLIADDHAIVRSGLRQIIATTSDLQVVAEAGDGAAVLAAVRGGGCDLLVMDMTMPGLSGVDLIRRVRTERPTLPILVLSMHNEGQVVSRALKAGAAGYVAKDCEPDILLAAMRKVAGGGRFLDPALVDAMVFDSGPADVDAPPLDLLSDREYQVLQLVARGQSLNEIGERLNVSAKTVSTHKARLMQKLGIDNNAELVRYAMRHGLLDQ